MRQAIVIIDMQVELFAAQPGPHCADRVVANINQVTARARAAGVPVLWVQHESAQYAPMHYQSRGWQLLSSLHTQQSDHVVRKTTPDAFLGTELQALLQQWQVEEIIVGGYASEFCVDSTIRSAAAKGYAIQLLADAHTTHDKAHMSAEHIIGHENATLPNIKSFGVAIRLTPTASLQLAN